MSGPVARYKDAGLAAYKTGDLDGAVREWSAAVEADKKNPGAEGTLGRDAAYNLGLAASTRANKAMRELQTAPALQRPIGAAVARAFLNRAADAFDYARRDAQGQLIAEPQAHLNFGDIQADVNKVALDTQEPELTELMVADGALNVRTSVIDRFETGRAAHNSALQSASVAPQKLDVPAPKFTEIVRSGYANLATQTALHTTQVALGAIAAFGDNQQAPMMEGVRAALGLKTGAEVREKFPRVTARQWGEMWTKWAEGVAAQSPVRNSAVLQGASALLVAEQER